MTTADFLRGSAPVRGAGLVALAAAIFVPYVPLAGPLSGDDVFALLGVMIGLFVVAFDHKKVPIDPPLLGFAALALIALISSGANAASLSDFARLCGRSVGRMAFYSALIVGVRAMVNEDSWARRGLIVFAAAATAEALFCLWAYWAGYVGPYNTGIVSFADWSVLSGRMRVQGTFSAAPRAFESSPVSPNFLAAYLVMAIPVTLGLALHQLKGRSLWLLCALLQVVTLYLTYTRAALGALAVAVLAFGLLLGRRRLAIAILVMAVLGAMSVSSVRRKLLYEGHDRWNLFAASLAITHDHPVFGVGDGNYEKVLHSSQEYFETPLGIATATSHNSILLAAAHYGILGGAAMAFLYLLLVLTVLRATHRSRGSPARFLTAGIGAAVFGYLAQDQLNNLSFVPKVTTQLWFLVALLPMLVPRRPKAEPEPSTEAAVVLPLPSV